MGQASSKENQGLHVASLILIAAPAAVYALRHPDWISLSVFGLFILPIFISGYIYFRLPPGENSKTAAGDTKRFPNYGMLYGWTQSYVDAQEEFHRRSTRRHPILNKSLAGRNWKEAFPIVLASWGEEWLAQTWALGVGSYRAAKEALRIFLRAPGASLRVPASMLLGSLIFAVGHFSGNEKASFILAMLASVCFAGRWFFHLSHHQNIIRKNDLEQPLVQFIEALPTYVQLKNFPMLGGPLSYLEAGLLQVGKREPYLTYQRADLPAHVRSHLERDRTLTEKYGLRLISLFPDLRLDIRPVADPLLKELQNDITVHPDQRFQILYNALWDNAPLMAHHLRKLEPQINKLHDVRNPKDKPDWKKIQDEINQLPVSETEKRFLRLIVPDGSVEPPPSLRERIRANSISYPRDPFTSERRLLGAA